MPARRRRASARIAEVKLGAGLQAGRRDARGRPATARTRVSEMQRARLLGATVAAIDEHGWSDTSVAHITARARVSRRTFYDLFSGREDCAIALLKDVAEQVTSELSAAGLTDLPWRERVRGGLWTILCFLDREPALARVCVVQSARGGESVLRAREQVLARLTSAIDAGRGEGKRAAEAPALTAEGLVGAVESIVHSRLLQGEPLSGLLNELTGMIVLPYLGSAAARRERVRALPPVPRKSTLRRFALGAGVTQQDPLKDVPMRLTYRTARVLEVVARHPGASNRLIGELAEIYDQGQVSKLLARLKGLDLLANTAGREAHTKGAANAWQLTELGEQVTEQLSLSTDAREDGGS